ncbi:ABC transporter ATP-binding protein [Streptococcus saliviloxodontae]|uniref:Iron complex transport system ATP-binding protein n=1 Tax=Streptococcus saliviloxodontae TaxID=1349416 RepID=A0ABS2PJS0_9STRE|nr:ABC transporter ATP-binding protein [Streptococcus saliviloxodontae]MBM7635673.1 iron complex transport system ATP-binding protein [Streptococcus saliviloxodontae]
MVITVSNLDLSYGTRKVLDQISLRLEEGQFISLIGPNGCGKSSLLKAMLGIIPVKKGQTFLDGQDLKSLKSKERTKRIAFLPQSPKVIEDISVVDFVSLGRYHSKKLFLPLSQTDKDLVAKALDWVGLSDFADQSVLSLSGGQLQRAFLAMVLAQDTDYIFLDEPTSYLDVNHQIEFIELLKKLQVEQGKTIVIVLHELPLVSKYSDQVVALHQGKVYQTGKPSEVFTDQMLLDVFSICATICPIRDSQQVMCYDFRKTDQWDRIT